jgi:hypothetical protein
MLKCQRAQCPLPVSLGHSTPAPRKASWGLGHTLEGDDERPGVFGLVASMALAALR